MKRVLFLALFMLTACETRGASHEYITYYLNKEYNGHPLNEFTSDYGYPVAEISKGRHANVYRWSSARPHDKPVTPDATGSASANYISYTKQEVFYSRAVHYYCEINIFTDARDIVTHFSVAVDSQGKWSSSRCSEIFDGVTPYEW